MADWARERADELAIRYIPAADSEWPLLGHSRAILIEGLSNAICDTLEQAVRAERERCNAVLAALRECIAWFNKAENNDGDCTYLNGDDRPVGEDGWSDGREIFIRAAALEADHDHTRTDRGGISMTTDDRNDPDD